MRRLTRARQNVGPQCLVEIGAIGHTARRRRTAQRGVDDCVCPDYAINDGKNRCKSRKKTMPTLLRRLLRVLPAPTLLVLTAAGCAVSPTANEAGRSKDDNHPFPVHEKVDVDADARGDFERALRHLKAGEHREGIALLQRVIERAPGHVSPYTNLAIAHQRLGDLPAAEQNIRKALELDPQHPVANTEYGLICRKTGKFKEARTAYEQALARDPNFLPARKNLGILCDVYLRDFDCALSHYQAYSAAVPADKAVPLWIADLEARIGRQRQ